MYGVIEYLMALQEVEKARLTSRERKGHRKKDSSNREPVIYDVRAQTSSKEAATCP